MSEDTGVQIEKRTEVLLQALNSYQKVANASGELVTALTESGTWGQDPTLTEPVLKVIMALMDLALVSSRVKGMADGMGLEPVDHLEDFPAINEGRPV